MVGYRMWKECPSLGRGLLCVRCIGSLGVAWDNGSLYHFRITQPVCASLLMAECSGKPFILFVIYGESAGARTQDQRLKRAMLYQLSYALRPHYQVSTVDSANWGRSVAA